MQGRELLRWEVLAAPKPVSLQASLGEAALGEVWGPGLLASVWGYRCATGVRGSPDAASASSDVLAAIPLGQCMESWACLVGREGLGLGAPPLLGILYHPPLPGTRCFQPVLTHVQTLWELMLLGEPLVVLAPSPAMSSELVLALIR